MSSGPGPAGSRRIARATVRRIVLISSTAKLAPMQRRILRTVGLEDRLDVLSELP